MSKKFFETDSFKKEQEVWNKKLKASGYNDIEATEDTAGFVRPQIFTVKKTEYVGGVDYYEYCQRVLREFPFKRDEHRAIFELHTEGKSLREIEEWLERHQDFKPLKKDRISQIIHRIKADFGRV